VEWKEENVFQENRMFKKRINLKFVPAPLPHFSPRRPFIAFRSPLIPLEFHVTNCHLQFLLLSNEKSVEGVEQNVAKEIQTRR